MKKLVILAVSAILAANVCAQEEKRECKQLSKEERVSWDIKRLTNELLLSDEQAEKFAVTYREYASAKDQLFEKNVKGMKCEPGKEMSDKELDKIAKQRFEGMKALADLQLKFYDKFRKDLSARQVEKVLHLEKPFGNKPCFGKHDGKQCHKHKGARGDFRERPRPERPQPAE